MWHTGRTRKNPEDYVWSPEEQAKCHKWRKHFAHYHDYDASYAWRPTAWLPSGWVWHLAHDGRFRRMQVDKVSAFTTVSIGPVVLQYADNRHRHDSQKVVGRGGGGGGGGGDDDGSESSGGESGSGESKSASASGSESSDEDEAAPKKPAAAEAPAGDVKRDALGLPISKQDAEEEADMLRQIGTQLRLKSEAAAAAAAAPSAAAASSALIGQVFDIDEFAQHLLQCNKIGCATCKKGRQEAERRKKHSAVTPMNAYAKWQEQQKLAGMRFICGNAMIGASESTTATAAAAPALRLTAEEATNVANEYAEKPLVNEAGLKASIKNAVETGAPVELEFEHKYVANMAGLQIKGAIEPALVQHVHVTLSGKTHTLPSGNKAYYFDLGIAPSSVEHGPNAEKRAVANKALKIEFNKQEMQYAPKLISKQLDLLVEGKVHEESIAATQKQLDKLICEALTPAAAAAAAAVAKK